MTPNASSEAMRTSIAKSNRSASRNRNLYPIQEQATLMEIWDYVPCECDSNCTCRRLGCKRHWKLREDLTFAEIVPAYVRMFVDKFSHERLRRSVSGRMSIRNLGRVQGALDVLQNVMENWDELYTEALGHNKTLLCGDWYTEFWRDRWTFRVERTSVYKAKQFCILLPDIGIPYDTNSRRSILNWVGGDATTYFHMLARLRERIIGIVEFENQSLPALRRLDAPQEQLPFNRKSISLRRRNFHYGDAYTPEERPLSRIIDKCFYRPPIQKLIDTKAHNLPQLPGGERCSR